MNNLFKQDWDGLAGIIAAVSAIIMHFFHVVDTSILLSVTVALVSLIFIRGLRRDHRMERIEESMLKTQTTLKQFHATLVPSEVLLVGPEELSDVTQEFSTRARGEMIWFNVSPLMFTRQELFDTFLRPAIENSQVVSIQFILDESKRSLWESELASKIKALPKSKKIKATHWTTIDENLSIIASNIGQENQTECLVSIWSEPFMLSMVGHQIPRYIFHVFPKSELLGRLIDLIRQHRFRLSSQNLVEQPA